MEGESEQEMSTTTTTSNRRSSARISQQVAKKRSASKRSAEARREHQLLLAKRMREDNLERLQEEEEDAVGDGAEEVDVNSKTHEDLKSEPLESVGSTTSNTDDAEDEGEKQESIGEELKKRKDNKNNNLDGDSVNSLSNKISIALVSVRVSVWSSTTCAGKAVKGRLVAHLNGFRFEPQEQSNRRTSPTRKTSPARPLSPSKTSSSSSSSTSYSSTSPTRRRSSPTVDSKCIWRVKAKSLSQPIHLLYANIDKIVVIPWSQQLLRHNNSHDIATKKRKTVGSIGEDGSGALMVYLVLNKPIESGEAGNAVQVSTRALSLYLCVIHSKPMTMF